MNADDLAEYRARVEEAAEVGFDRSDRYTLANARCARCKRTCTVSRDGEQGEFMCWSCESEWGAE